MRQIPPLYVQSRAGRRPAKEWHHCYLLEKFAEVKPAFLTAIARSDPKEWSRLLSTSSTDVIRPAATAAGGCTKPWSYRLPGPLSKTLVLRAACSLYLPQHMYAKTTEPPADRWRSSRRYSVSDQWRMVLTHGRQRVGMRCGGVTCTASAAQLPCRSGGMWCGRCSVHTGPAGTIQSALVIYTSGKFKIRMQLSDLGRSPLQQQQWRRRRRLRRQASMPRGNCAQTLRGGIAQ